MAAADKELVLLRDLKKTYANSLSEKQNDDTPPPPPKPLPLKKADRTKLFMETAMFGAALGLYYVTTGEMPRLSPDEVTGLHNEETQLNAVLAQKNMNVKDAEIFTQGVLQKALQQQKSLTKEQAAGLAPIGSVHIQMIGDYYSAQNLRRFKRSKRIKRKLCSAFIARIRS